MKYLRISSVLLLWLIAVPVLAQTNQDSDSLRDAGQMRPNDIISEQSRWNRASVDLFTYWLDSGLYGYYGAQPEMLIDGIPVDINYFGWQNINMLPLYMNDIKKTTSRASPSTYNNSFAGAGAIDFQTALPDTGFSFASSFYIGNESGDPGPYVYDSLKTTPNIDRWGPDGSVFLAYQQDGWYAKGLFSFRNHQQTDLISNQRIHITTSVLGTNQEYINYKIQTTTKSGLLESGYRRSGWDIKARAMYGEDKDYLFLQPFGREIPVKTTYQQFAIRGKYETGNWVLANRYVAHNKEIGKRFPLHTYIFDWDQTTHTFSSAASYHGNGFNFKPAIIYERLQTRAPGIVEPYNDLVTFSLDGNLSFGRAIDLNLHANVDYDEAETAETFSIGLPVKLTDTWTVTPEFFYSELLPLRQHSFSHWLTRGYTFADELGITISSPVEALKNRLSSFKLINRFSLTENWMIELEQQLIQHDALNVPWQIVEENEFLDTLPGQFTATSEEGSRFHFRALIENHFSDYLQQEFSVQFRHTVSGSQRYKEYFRQVPQSKIGYKLDISPVQNLNLSLKADYRSSTQWLEYRALEGVEYKLPSGIPIRPFSGTFHTTTPSFTNVTVSVQKWFWNRQFNTQFSVQNLLNQEVRYHTMGAELFTKFNIRMGVNF